MTVRDEVKCQFMAAVAQGILAGPASGALDTKALAKKCENVAEAMLKRIEGSFTTDDRYGEIVL